MRPNRLLVPSIVLGAALSAARPAAADDFSEVQALLESLDYDAAVQRLEPIVADSDRDPADRLRALELIAVARVGAGRDDDARATFARLRAADPGWRLQDASYSPKIQHLFREANPEPATGRLSVSLGSSTEREVLVRVQADTARLYISELEIGWRWGEAGDMTPARLGRQAAADGFPIPRLPGAPGRTRLRVVASAHAPSGAIVARAGSDDSPVVLEIDPPVSDRPASSSGSILGRWWLWAGVGAVVAGGVVLAIAVSSGGDDLPEPTLGTQRMR